MTADPTPSLVVKITCGGEELEKLNQGWNIAALAASSGVHVHVFLTGDAVLTAVPGKAEQLELAEATPIQDLRSTVLSSGGDISVCTQCAARRDLGEDDLVEGAHIRGAAVFLEQVMAPGARSLVY